MVIKYRQLDGIGKLLLQRHLYRGAVKWFLPPFHFRAPIHRIGKNLPDFGHMVNRVLLMPRLKVKDSSLSALERAPAAKYLAACKPSCKHNIIRLWNIEVLPIHLLHRNVKMRRNALRYRVVWRCCKQPLPVAVFPA